MSASTASPTIVLIHGLFVTPVSWEHWTPGVEEL
jgi:hypothetical protein